MAKFELYTDENDEYRWRLIAANDTVIALSGDGYKHKGDCESAIDLVRLVAPIAEVNDQTVRRPPAGSASKP